MYRTFYLQRKDLRLNNATQLVNMSSKKRASQKRQKRRGSTPDAPPNKQAPTNVGNSHPSRPASLTHQSSDSE